MRRKNRTQIHCRDVTWITVALDKKGWQIFAKKNSENFVSIKT
jgi:hypothetical protein